MRARLFAVATLCFACSALADEEVEPAAVDEPKGAALCPALFGDEDARAQNRASREQHLMSVERQDRFVEIVHGVPEWSAPVVRTAPGLTVLAVEGEPGARAALVRVDERWQRWCEPGVYRVGRDDALGAGSEVLAVLDEGLLAAHVSGLMLLPVKGTNSTTTFRMIWRSGFGIHTASAGGGSGAPASPRTSPAKRARDVAKTLTPRAALPAALQGAARAPRKGK